MPSEKSGTGQVVMLQDHMARLPLETVFRQNERRLRQFLRLRLGSDAEAEDVAQATFLKLWRRRDALHNENLLSLLFVTARNIATDILRQRRRLELNQTSRPGTCAELASIRDEAGNAEHQLSMREELGLVLKIIDELPQKCRTAFIAYRFDSLRYGEIAERMAISESMVRKYVLRATAYCAARFDELEGWE